MVVRGGGKFENFFFKMAAMGGLGHISLVSLSHLSVFPSNFYSSSNIVVLCIVL